MSVAPPLTADVAELLSNPPRISDCKVSFLKAAWKQVDQYTTVVLLFALVGKLTMLWVVLYA